MRFAVALTVVLVSLNGCSSDPEQDYCDQLSGARATLVGLALRSGGDEGSYLEPALRLFEDLRESSPSRLRDEWDTFAFAWRDLVEAVEDTGVDPTTFDPAKKPEDLSDADFERVKGAAAELGSARVRDAVDGITQHAKDVCDLSLDL
ncbi:MAG TPA: hypothetical protein VLI04_04520 [Nocardioidaceae bacterium]|nr:hypothetical protein [Nocardioidaceae bacterium]